MTARRDFHFVFGLRPQVEPFHLIHWLALESCRRTQDAATIHLHYRHLPCGPWWDRIEPHLDVHRVGAAPRGFDTSRYAASDEGRLIASRGCDYAHEADFLRLEILCDGGGAYADIDTLFVAPYPDEWFERDCVIGEEPSLPDGDGVLRPSLCNAVILARPGAAFVRRWIDEGRASFDGTWNRHSCAAAARLWAADPDAVHVLPQRAFYRHGPRRAGIATLFEERDDSARRRREPAPVGAPVVGRHARGPHALPRGALHARMGRARWHDGRGDRAALHGFRAGGLT